MDSLELAIPSGAARDAPPASALVAGSQPASGDSQARPWTAWPFQTDMGHPDGHCSFSRALRAASRERTQPVTETSSRAVT